MTSGPLRVLVLDQAVGVWGAQRYVLRLAPLLRDRGIELTLAVPKSLEIYEAWRSAGFEAIDLDLPIHRSIRTAGRPSLSGLVREGMSGLRTVRLIAALVRRGGYDAIWANAHWIHMEAGLAGIICRRPVILHLHEELMPGLGVSLRAAAIRLATGAVSVSHAIAVALPSSLTDRVRVIPNGVDVDVMSPPGAGDESELRLLRRSFGVADGHLMALAATRLDPDKRIEDLVSAVEMVGDTRLRFVVAGITSRFPDYENRLRAKAEIVAPGRVIFCGNREDMAALLQASDVVIHAGVVEGMPLGLLEAQSCGKPVVAYRVAGVPEAVIDGSTGFLAEPRDVEALTAGLRRLVEDATLRTEMGAAARVHVMANHRIQTQAERNVAFLNEVCGRAL